WCFIPVFMFIPIEPLFGFVSVGIFFAGRNVLFFFCFFFLLFRNFVFARVCLFFVFLHLLSSLLIVLFLVCLGVLIYHFFVIVGNRLFYFFYRFLMDFQIL